MVAHHRLPHISEQALRLQFHTVLLFRSPPALEDMEALDRSMGWSSFLLTMSLDSSMLSLQNTSQIVSHSWPHSLLAHSYAQPGWLADSQGLGFEFRSQEDLSAINVHTMQGDHSPDNVTFPDISLTVCGTLSFIAFITASMASVCNAIWSSIKLGSDAGHPADQHDTRCCQSDCRLSTLVSNLLIRSPFPVSCHKIMKPCSAQCVAAIAASTKLKTQTLQALQQRQMQRRHEKDASPPTA